jgi:hypothetical protein
MPGTTSPTLPTQDQGETDENVCEKVEDLTLVLPSSLEPEERLTTCRHRVAECEQQFRVAQLEDSLTELRRVRRIRRTLVMNHRAQIAGQGRKANTRSRSLIDGIQERINKFAQRYRAAYRALLQLDPAGNWKITYLELRECDNRGPGKEVEEQGVGDGAYTTSWIWLSNPRAREPSGATDRNEGATEEEFNDAMRVEWATSFARMERWDEEVELLQEEMRRVVAFLEWKSTDWLRKRELRSALVASDIRSGLDAYARKQAAVYHDLAVSFSLLWKPTLVSYNLKHSWISEFQQRHQFSFNDATDTAPSHNRGIFKHRIRSDATGTTHNQLDPSPSSQAHYPSTASSVDGVTLEEEESDVSTDTAGNETDVSEFGDDDLYLD